MKVRTNVGESGQVAIRDIALWYATPENVLFPTGRSGSATLPKMPTVGPIPQTGSPSTLTFAPANALVPLTPAPTLSFAKLPTDTEYVPPMPLDAGVQQIYGWHQWA